MKKRATKILLSFFLIFSLHFSLFAQQLTVDVLVVSGGGSGGAGYGGGGGGGAVKYFTSQTVSGTKTVVVGSGGAAVNITTSGTTVTGNPGESSSFGTLVATSSSSANGPNAAGGGGGGAGSGGGAGGNFNTASILGGTAVSGMGNNGGGSKGNGANFSNVCGGGGGGAGAVGGSGGTTTIPALRGGVGGDGISNSISGVAVFYGGGGGGGVTFNGNAGGAGGNGGGGAGSKGDVAATNGTANTGGGGGGFGASNGGASNNYSGAGGSGVVIVRYLGNTILASGGTITQVDGYTIHTFNSNGTFALPCNANTGDTTATACGSFVWYGVTYTSSATPTRTFTNVGGCDSVVTLNLTINALPTPTFTSSPNTACLNTNVTYTTQSGQTNYSWMVSGTQDVDYSITSGGLGSSSNTVTLKWLTAGSKNVNVNYTDQNGCTSAGTDIPTNGLVGYWPFTGNANDASIGGHNGQLRGTTLPALITDRRGKSNSAYAFTEGGTIPNHIYVGRNVLSNFSQMAVSLWFKTGSTVTSFPLSSGNNNEYNIQINPNGKIGTGTYHCFNGTVTNGGYLYTESSNAYNDNSWHHAVLVYDGSYNKLYVDGVFNSQVQNTSGTTTPGCASNANYSDLSFSSYYLYGDNLPLSSTEDLDDIAIYNRALSSNEVADLFNSQNSEIIEGATSTTIVSITNTGDTTAIACGSFVWYGQTYTTSGTPTRTFTNVSGCDSVVTLHLTINPIPATPSVNVVNNCNGTSTLSTTATGTLFWSTGATTSSIIVSSAGTYTVTQTVDGCTSETGSGIAAPKTTPSTPTVNVVNNCNGTSTLSTTATGTLLWSTGATTSSIIVSSAGTYTVSQTVDGCTSEAGSGIAAPKTTPATPTVNVVNNTNGTSTLSTAASGTLLWSNGATTSSIIVSSAGIYTVTQTVDGCASVAGSGTAAPITQADPAVGNMYFTTTAGATQDANNLMLAPSTAVYDINVPFYNLNQTNAIPNQTIEFRVNLGRKLILNPGFNLATAPLSSYFDWTATSVGGDIILVGAQKASIPADFDGIATFRVKGDSACRSNVVSNIVVTNLGPQLSDDDGNNNTSSLQYNLPITLTRTFVNITCNGANNGSISVVASSGTRVIVSGPSGYADTTYLPSGSNNFTKTGLLPGVYSIAASATSAATTGTALASCSVSTTAIITEPTVLALPTGNISNTNIICFGASDATITVSATGGTSPYTYVITGPTVNTSGALSGTFTGLTAGSYTITVTDNNGCTAQSSAIVITAPSGITDITLGSDVTATAFNAPGVTQTIVYNIAEIAASASVGDTIRITKVNGFTINFSATQTQATVGSTTYNVNNSNWKIDNSNAAFVSIILTDPGNSNAPGTILCSSLVRVAISITRNSPDISVFTLSARLRKADGEVNLNNNLNSIIFSAE